MPSKARQFGLLSRERGLLLRRVSRCEGVEQAICLKRLHETHDEILALYAAMEAETNAEDYGRIDWDAADHLLKLCVDSQAAMDRMSRECNLEGQEQSDASLP